MSEPTTTFTACWFEANCEHNWGEWWTSSQEVQYRWCEQCGAEESRQPQPRGLFDEVAFADGFRITAKGIQFPERTR